MSEHPLVLKLDVSGHPREWINYEQAAYYYAKGLVAWTIGTKGYTLHGGKSRMTGLRSFMDVDTIIAVRNEKEMKHEVLFRVPTLTNKGLFRRDHSICAYCGEVFSYDHLTRDHVIPRSRNGKDVWTNVVSACGPCNKHKDNRTPEEANMKLLYVPYAPNRAEHLLLMNRTILADQMEFLLARVGKESRFLDPAFKSKIIS